MKELRDNLSEFKEAGAEIVACSTDSFFTHKAWYEGDTQNLGDVGYPVLADTNHAVARSYGVLLEDMGIALRGTFIIDKEGTLRHALVNDLPVGRSVKETLRTLQSLVTGKLIQCEWKPGDKTLN